MEAKRVFHLIILLLSSLSWTACNYKLKPFDEVINDTLEVKIHRYDRMESLYLTTGDFSALRQMSTDYPNETRTLIERVLRLGSVEDPDINSKLLTFFQDSTLQTIIQDAELQYANMDDLNAQLTDAFHQLGDWLPGIKVPLVYAQISALDQSIIVGDESVGICLDKYLGSDYPLYSKFYDSEQRKTMKRKYVVPDFLGFYLVSLYPLENFHEASQSELDLHFAKALWVVNKLMDEKLYDNQYVRNVDLFMAKHPKVSIEDLLKMRSID